MTTKKIDSQRGQSLVLIALMMVGMIAFLGLVIDGGQVYVSKRNAQDAADSAAFAGVRKLALRNDDSQTSANVISNTISNFAGENGVASPNDVVAYFIDKDSNNICKIPCTGVPTSPLATGVRVTVTVRFQPNFINLVTGGGQVSTNAVAAAQSGTPGAATLTAPMLVPFPCSPYDPNNISGCTAYTYNVDYALVGDKVGAGGFQWADFSCGTSQGQSANNIVNYLSLNWTGPVIMADRPDTYYDPSNPTRWNSPPPDPNPWFCGSTGFQPNSNVQTVLDAWLDLSKWGVGNLGGGAAWGPKPKDSKWIVPITDVNNGLTGSSLKLHTVILGEFQFDGYWFGNNQCNYAGAVGNYSCTKNLPAPLQNCHDSKFQCLMGKFLKEVENLPTIPGSCNASGVDICGVGLSQ